TLILVGPIDNAGYMCLFGNRCCQICRSDRELVSVIPNRQSLHIAPCAAHDLVAKELVTGLKIVPSDEPKECEACVKVKLTHQEIPEVHQGERATRFGKEVW
ncbi:hypothetical protein L208DRAFT_1299569, partial [Tricholoma matsutake]